jgi:hypothetical protein
MLDFWSFDDFLIIGLIGVVVAALPAGVCGDRHRGGETPS